MGKSSVEGYSTLEPRRRAVRACFGYNTNGSLDTTFGTGGVVDVNASFGNLDIGDSLAIDSAGRIDVAGYVGFNNNGEGARTFRRRSKLHAQRYARHELRDQRLLLRSCRRATLWLRCL